MKRQTAVGARRSVDLAWLRCSYDSAPGIILLLLRFCCAGASSPPVTGGRSAHGSHSAVDLSAARHRKAPAGYFCWALWSTYRIENRPDKQACDRVAACPPNERPNIRYKYCVLLQSFYVAFGACFGAWLVSTPTVVGVGLVLNPWVRLFSQDCDVLRFADS